MEPINGNRGFTVIEIIAILIIIAVIATIVIGGMIGVSDTSKVAQQNVIKNHLRYAQSTAMKRGAIWGIKCNGADYWLFQTNAPDTPSNQIALPGEGTVKVTLANKKVTMSAFTVFFDAKGKPYTAYTDAVANTPVSAANPLSITINSIPAGAPGTFGITPETGFIP